MLRVIEAIWEFLGIVARRIRVQGWRTTLLWLYAVGMARITGRVPLRYSRITPKLYVGPQYRSGGRSALERAGITATVSLRAEYDDKKHGLTFTDYSYLPTVDNTAPTLAQLEEGVAFIRRIIEAGGTVYVHCGSGVGRAPSLATAYLIAEGLPVEDAVAQIEQVRPFIRILPAQMERLREYEELVRAGKSAPEPEPLKTAPDVQVEGHIADEVSPAGKTPEAPEAS